MVICVFFIFVFVYLRSFFSLRLWAEFFLFFLVCRPRSSKEQDCSRSSDDGQKRSRLSDEYTRLGSRGLSILRVAYADDSTQAL